MYNSPTTFAGTGRRRRSSTYRAMLVRGRPSGGASEPDIGPYQLEIVVHSVGPYRLIIRRSADHASTNGPGTASPATTSVIPVGRLPGGRAASAEGGIVR